MQRAIAMESPVGGYGTTVTEPRSNADGNVYLY
jgi:hypothetical protein